MLFRIFQQKPSEMITIAGDDYRYLTKVLRLKDGAFFEVIDGTSRVKVYQVVNLDKRELKAKDYDEYIQEESISSKLTLIIPLTTTDKCELVIQKATELGVSALAFYQANSSTLKIKEDDKKIERWQKIVLSAVCQSRRITIPKLSIKKDLKEALSGVKDFYFADINEEARPLSDINREAITLVFGPESGYSDQERAFLSEQGQVVSLGQNVLRTETAPIAAAAKLLLP